MSIAQFSLNLSYFNISIDISRNEKKEQQKIQQKIERQMNLSRVEAEREKTITNFLSMYNSFRI